MDLYKTCPSCTWRMEIELEEGICPQCGVNWHELQAAEHHAHLTPESPASSQAVVNASALEQSDGNTPPAQAQVA